MVPIIVAILVTLHFPIFFCRARVFAITIIFGRLFISLNLIHSPFHKLSIQFDVRIIHTFFLSYTLKCNFNARSLWSIVWSMIFKRLWLRMHVLILSVYNFFYCLYVVRVAGFISSHAVSLVYSPSLVIAYDMVWASQAYRVLAAASSRRMRIVVYCNNRQSKNVLVRYSTISDLSVFYSLLFLQHCSNYDENFNL